MEVKPGYKQTEVGVIPESWEVTSIGNIATAEGGYAFSSKNFLRSGTYQVIKMSNLYGGSLDLERSASFLNELDEQEKHYLLRPAEILITLTGTIGKRDYGYAYKIDHEQNLLLNQRVARLIVGESANPIYVASQIKMSCFLDQFFDVSKGGTGNQANVGTGDLAAIQIPLPPLAEQEAIAEALSDADALIESLEQLLAKKRQLKQGAMQELLTGKKRLPGFSGEWEVKRLGEVCRLIVDGTHFTPRYVEAGIPFYSVENVTANDFTNTKFISAEEHFQLIKRCKPEKGDILLTRIGSIGDTKLIDWDVEASIYVSLALLKVNDHIDSGYLYCYSKCRQFVRDMEERSLMNASPKKINMGDIGDVPVSLPDISEQSAIAAILSDMDAEIATLEAKLTKARHIKQGMMQELLTGRIRLV